jgi:diguanylate cyclase (GGDEF)-like protein/PAS domain S-box-containing protein
MALYSTHVFYSHYQGDAVLGLSVLGHPNRKILAVLATVWFCVFGFLVIGSYQHDQDFSYKRLYNKSESAFIQFERDWPDLKLDSKVEQIVYLNLLSEHFNPSIQVSIITESGRIIASTLSNLTQLSYSPVVYQFKNAQDEGEICIYGLSSLQAHSVNACAHYLESAEVYLIVSIHKDDFIYYWADHNFYLISAVIIGMLTCLVLYYILSNQQKILLHKQNIAVKNYQQQGSDFKRLLSNLPGLVYRLQVKNKKMDYVSPGSMQLLGYSPDYFIDNDITPFNLIEEDDQHDFNRQSHAAHFSLKPFELIYRLKTIHGERKWVLDRGRCYIDQDGVQFVEGVILDITERELVRQQIEYLAIQDPLTELYNRYKFNDELVNAVDDANRRHEHFAMLFIDLDRFKTINDSLGHQLGDRLLRKVASRLQTIIPKQHFLGRMGGDEFVILMRSVGHVSEVEILARNINRSLRKPFSIDNYQLRTSCSIGISLCPDDSTHSHILWRYSDTAMYQVKNRGGDGFQFFTAEMGEVVQHRIKIEHAFVPALENKEFELHYQPQVDIKTNLVIGAEALIRWHHPTLGFISPEEFIPIAEETGFINELGDWIINEALAQLSKWSKVNKDFTMAINVSAMQIKEEFPKKLNNLLMQHSVYASNVELEITESLLMENIDFVQPLLTTIKELGVKFAIDDFGTGYSSLSYLRYLPIDKLKIDRAFIMNLESNEADVAMAKSIIAMAKNLKLKVLAEGIETVAQLDILKAQECDSYQGYYFGIPVDKDKFYSLYIDS